MEVISCPKSNFESCNHVRFQALQVWGHPRLRLCLERLNMRKLHLPLKPVYIIPNFRIPNPWMIRNLPAWHGLLKSDHHEGKGTHTDRSECCFLPQGNLVQTGIHSRGRLWHCGWHVGCFHLHPDDKSSTLHCFGTLRLLVQSQLSHCIHLLYRCTQLQF